MSIFQAMPGVRGFFSAKDVVGKNKFISLSILIPIFQINANMITPQQVSVRRPAMGTGAETGQKRNVNGNGTGTGRERDGNGTGTGRERNGTGRERDGNGTGTGRELDGNGTRKGTET